MDHKFNEILKFPHKFQLRRVIRTRGGKEGVLPVAKVIYETHLKPLDNFRTAVHFFLDVCYTVDQVKCDTIGINAPTDVSNDVQTAIGQEILKGMAWDDRDVNWLEDNTEAFQAQNEFLTRWGATKLGVLMNIMKHIKGTRWFAGQKVLITDEQRLQAESEYDTVETHIREMMEGLVQLRRYGVKSSFTRRGIMDGGKGAWVMWDSRDFTKLLATPRKGLIASVVLATDVDQIKDLRLERILKEKTQLPAIELPFPAAFYWTMRQDGEIDLSGGLGSIMARDVFHDMGADLVYQAVRLQLTYHLYDLVVPVAKLATLPSAHTLKAGVLAKLQRALGLTKKDPVVDLMIPRMRLLDDQKGLVEAAEQEIEHAVVDTRSRALRQHDVTDFIRPLPKGHRPSPQARKRAYEAFGIELGDNETFVRAHKRGSGDAITAHEAKRVQR